MKKYNVTVNGVTYEVLVEEAGVAAAPAAVSAHSGTAGISGKGGRRSSP